MGNEHKIDTNLVELRNLDFKKVNVTKQTRIIKKTIIKYIIIIKK